MAQRKTGYGKLLITDVDTEIIKQNFMMMKWVIMGVVLPPNYPQSGMIFNRLNINEKQQDGVRKMELNTKSDFREKQ